MTSETVLTAAALSRDFDAANHLYDHRHQLDGDVVRMLRDVVFCAGASGADGTYRPAGSQLHSTGACEEDDSGIPGRRGTSITEAADQVAEGVRILSLRTAASNCAMSYPTHVYGVVQRIKTAAERMPQLFSQLAVWVEREHAEGRVAHVDPGRDTAEYVASVTDALGRACQDAEILAAALECAAQATFQLQE